MLLKTKFLAPAYNPKSVERNRLISRLENRHGRKLTTIVAPAGYGKTTLVTQWIHSQEITYSWLSLDEPDNESRRFWQYIIGTLANSFDSIGVESLKLLNDNQTPIEAAVTALVNEICSITSSSPIYLILDDYHRITNTEIHQSITFLIDYLPQNIQMVITSRVEPALPIARWRVRNIVDEIHAHDLAFSIDESRLFFNEYMSLNLSDEDIALAREKSEGWVAAMQLAAISTQGNPTAASSSDVFSHYSGEHKLISDYVLSEILDSQPDNIKSFLLETSCLIRLNAQLCDALRQSNDSQSYLEELNRINLFIIPLDTQNNWFRYHDLFRESLLQRLKQNNPKDLVLFQERAINWLLQQGQLHEAINQLIQLKDWSWLARALEVHGNNLIHEGYHLPVLEWLSYITDDTLDEHPRLIMLKVWALFFSNKIETTLPLLDRLEDILDKRVCDSHPEAQDALALHSEISLIRSYLARSQSDLASATDLTQQVLDDLDNSNMPLKSVTYYGLGMDCFAQGDLSSARSALQASIEYGKNEKRFTTVLSSTGLLGWILYYLGELDLAREICTSNQSWIDGYHDPSQPKLISCWQNCALAQIYREKNQLTTAESYINPLLNHLEVGTEPGQHILIQYVRAYMAFSVGDYKSAITWLDDAINVYEHKQDSLMFEPPSLDALRTRCYLALGENIKAEHWVKTVEKAAVSISQVNKEQQDITVARVLISQAHYQKAITKLTAVCEEATKDHHIKHLIELWILQAIAYSKLNNIEQSRDAITEAMILASKEGIIKAFCDEGSLVRDLVILGNSVSIPDSYKNELNAALNISTQDKEVKLVETLPTKTTATLQEPLSQREQEVLTLINEGLANKVIASQLFLAPATVKAHIRNIYGKIGAKSRTEALAKAREYGLL
ncbi:LuxR C-terminal-related transcriptional regulator [Alkalimarinus alittae]|uniref:LuxR C-terminal-related transcriptional regulator n=1 Tax=Alkalimarinus alittae TaxID=2961619 RepID=A0ABY6N768_9ALTE|nr:LuxR C-terminal-related transcriptional regulator [Alkalimarinus alittae]UZE97822.1 LuxR C-terminal-related transcriptional regulator [Alkalimarinus alittae]